MKRRAVPVILAVLMLSTIAFGQMQLNYVYSRAVKEGYSLHTIIDSLILDSRVNSGLAMTRCALVLTPAAFSDKYVRSIIVEDTASTTDPIQIRMLDSIEISMNFHLPADFVVDSMWLWIDGEPVAGAIQDRSLASLQYQQIVGVRRDPALLEFWGNGSYNLRIFPASSLKSRKVMIEFHHTFDDDSIEGASASANLPFSYDSAYAYNASGTVQSEKKIGAVKASFAAEDAGEYSVVIPGVGEGTFSSSKPLELAENNVGRLQAGRISIHDPSGKDEFLWIGRDPVSSSLTAGISASLSDETMKFMDEPDTRIIVMDMRNSVWDWNEYYKKQAESYGRTSYVNPNYQKYNVWERAQKFAVLSLQQYLSVNQKFNVLIGGETVQSVFGAPVEANAGNIEKALTAVVGASSSPEASTADLLRAAISQAPDGIVVLISDLMQPPDCYTVIDNSSVLSDAGKEYNDKIVAISEVVKESDITLFTINDLYQLTSIALQSGGYQLAGILNRYNVAYRYEIVEGKRITIPQLPSLFGSANRSGLSDFTITSPALTDIVFTLEGNYGQYYYAYDLVGRDIALAKNKIAAPDGVAYYYAQNTAFIRIAGKLGADKTGAPVDVKVSGKMGGLWFSQLLKGVGTPYASNQVAADPQWAFRKSEYLATEDPVDNAVNIKAIGKEYHLITRQTSLLALEKGMELWEDTVWQSNEEAKTNTGVIGGSGMETAMRDYSEAGSAPTASIGSGVEFDGISLADLLLKRSSAVETSAKGTVTGFSVRSFGNVLHITAPATGSAVPIALNLYDLSGRLVARKKISSHDGSAILWDPGKGARRLSGGMYTMHIMSGSLKKIFRITLMGR